MTQLPSSTSDSHTDLQNKLAVWWVEAFAIKSFSQYPTENGLSSPTREDKPYSPQLAARTQVFCESLRPAASVSQQQRCHSQLACFKDSSVCVPGAASEWATDVNVQFEPSHDASLLNFSTEKNSRGISNVGALRFCITSRSRSVRNRK